MSGFFIVITIVCLIVGVMFFAWQQKKKRTADLSQAADELGLLFFPDGESSQRGTFAEFELMNRGRDQKFSNLIVAETEELKISLFDYEYSTGHGKHRRKHTLSIAAIASHHFQLPAFRARPEGFFDGVGSALGFQDIDFDEHSQFSSAFVIKSAMEEETRQFFDGPLLDHFAKNPELSFEAAGHVFVFYRDNKKTKPENLKSWLEKGYRSYGALRDRQARATAFPRPTDPRP